MFIHLGVSHLWLVFPAFYFLLSTLFLNQMYHKGVLFPCVPYKEHFIYFTSDIFDVFWLIIAAIPNTLFSGAFFFKTYSTFSKDHKEPVLILILIAATIVVLWFGFISPTTNSFNAHENVWSNALSWDTLLLYNLFELISIINLSIEGVCTLFYFICFGTASQREPSIGIASLPTYALVASTIMFLYWVMLVLSNMSNMKISNGSVGEPKIFPKYYGPLGSIALLAVTVSIYLFWKVPSISRINPTAIISSIILPGTAIILQVIQIVQPQWYKSKKRS